MDGNKYNEKILGFIELLEKHNIEIPIIQRDYAQGRRENVMILEKFLETLKDIITTNSEIKLDFIYGNIVGEAFQPLDGQQRLTTLFLLHWYAARKCNVYSEDTKKLLLKFSYETRISSREFCNALVNNEFNFPSETCEKELKISDIIIDANWFFLSWKKDPTINSMLNSIDLVDKCFCNVDDLWEKLSKQKSILFYYIELENIGLSDDLYIKMNARGRLLTPFESFKAELQKKSNDQDWNTNERYDDSFAFNIDTKWTDFFWYKFKRNNSVDFAHMRFITAVMMNRIAISKMEEKTQIVQQLNDQINYVNVNLFTKEYFDYLFKCYEIYRNHEINNQDLKLKFPLWRHESKKSILSDIVYEGGMHVQSSLTLKVLFYAQTEYMLRMEKFNKDSFQIWMRVIRNIVSRGDVDKEGKRPDIIRSPQTFVGVINLIQEMADGCEDIYSFLSKNNLKSTFAREQVEEERLKARLIKAKPDLKELIWRAEDIDLLRGRINFVLYCSGYFDKEEILNEELFSNVCDVLEKYFYDEKFPSDFRRAMLSIEVNGQYEFYNYWWSKWAVVNATKRKLFVNFRELEYFIYSDYRDYFKKMILLLIEKDFKQIIDDFIPPNNMPAWKSKLIKGDILVGNTCNYIAIPDSGECCYLLKSRRPRELEGSILIK